MKRRICVLTGSRAEFGLLRWLMQDLKDDPGVRLQVIATGMHLAVEFGSTYREIEQAGFEIDEKVEMLLSGDTASSVAKSMGLGMIGFADAYARLEPDLLVVLGDRFEILAAAAAACVARIPIAHLHGGETTEGAFDEAIRHSVTKMSQLHFVAAEQYRRRVIQLGESPERVHLVGGLGVDAIRRVQLLDRASLEQSLDFRFGRRNLLVTFHPVTLEGSSSADQVRELLAALHELRDTQLLFTQPNADSGGREIALMVKDFVDAHPNSRVFTSLGQQHYLSCLKLVDGVVGNSSSGLCEAPTFGVGTINIGERQKGRLQASSVINCPPERAAVLGALEELYSARFRQALPGTVNPYGDGGASGRIARLLGELPLDGLVKKAFFDLHFALPNRRTAA